MYLHNEQLIVPPIGYKVLDENMLLMLNHLDFLFSSSKIEHPCDIESVITIKVAQVEA